MHGTSPLISSVLIVVAVMVSTFIVMGVLTPTLERYKEVADFLCSLPRAENLVGWLKQSVVPLSSFRLAPVSPPRG